VLDWPYTEGLRLDEAMHPLTIMASGLYGDVLPNQNGAPLRLVVPWKYGFKSGKSIVKIRFTDKEPRTTWVKSAAAGIWLLLQRQSGCRPSGAGARRSERRIGEFFKRKTLMFNGYAEQVGQLYTGMDLRKNF
jgi:sulfoxide reductase catalytic subunit YedY